VTSPKRKLGEQVAAACGRQQRLLEALLTLSRSEYGRLRHEPVDLAATAAAVLRAHDPHRLKRSTVLEPARTTGDPQLIERLVANLIENAIRHNLPGGRLEIVTHTGTGCATFAIANTGPVIPTGELARLFEPFERLSSHPWDSADGVGLGLAIVQANRRRARRHPQRTTPNRRRPQGRNRLSRRTTIAKGLAESTRAWCSKDYVRHQMLESDVSDGGYGW
jgi:signal transduction histidine kinase